MKNINYYFTLKDTDLNLVLIDFWFLKTSDILYQNTDSEIFVIDLDLDSVALKTSENKYINFYTDL